jgi:hypothetical protein
VLTDDTITFNFQYKLHNIENFDCVGKIIELYSDYIDDFRIIIDDLHNIVLNKVKKDDDEILSRELYKKTNFSKLHIKLLAEMKWYRKNVHSIDRKQYNTLTGVRNYHDKFFNVNFNIGREF